MSRDLLVLEKESTNMAFSSVPQESKSRINSAAKSLRDKILDMSPEELEEAVQLVSKWRACHAYPINTFNSTLRTKLKNHLYKDFIVAQRLKRLPTIIDKLSRYPNMQLTTMQDIGGIRAILKSVNDVYKLRNEYVRSPHFKGMVIDEKDYINGEPGPRDTDGYRSLHLIFKYENKLNPNYNGLKLEMQIRTKLQHAWATAVETMGTFLGQALKSRQGDERWLEFFAVTSSALSYLEKTTPIPRFKHFTEKQTFKEVARMESELSALEKMRGFSVAINAIHKDKGKGSSYFLVKLDSLNKEVTITPYDRDNLSKAMKDYAAVELEVTTQNKKLEPVLVSSGPIASLKKAYPNFFLDTTEFVVALQRIISLSNVP